MLAAKVLLVSVLVILFTGSIERAVAQSAPPAPSCQIEEINLQLVERDRKADERKLATMAVQLRVATDRIAQLEKELGEAKKAGEKPKAETAAPAGE